MTLATVDLLRSLQERLPFLPCVSGKGLIRGHQTGKGCRSRMLEFKARQLPFWNHFCLCLCLSACLLFTFASTIHQSSKLSILSPFVLPPEMKIVEIQSSMFSFQLQISLCLFVFVGENAYCRLSQLIKGVFLHLIAAYISICGYRQMCT